MPSHRTIERVGREKPHAKTTGERRTRAKKSTSELHRRFHRGRSQPQAELWILNEKSTTGKNSETSVSRPVKTKVAQDAQMFRLISRSKSFARAERSSVKSKLGPVFKMQQEVALQLDLDVHRDELFIGPSNKG